MASVKPSSLISDVSGSVGDVTFGRNQGGLFVRERVSPAQPPSDERDARQAAITAISQAWSGTLTETQRSTWRTYSRRHPLPDRFGRPKTPSGICHFIKCNVQRYRDESAITATSAPDSPPPPMPAFTAAASAAAALAVAGDPNPDCTGTYKLAGTVDGKPYWKHTAAEWYTGWDTTWSKWFLSSSPGIPGGNFWWRWDPVTGSYTPQAPATGNPVAAWSAAESSVTLTPTTAISTASPANTRLFAYAGQQVTLGRAYYRTPFRYIGRNTYDGSDWNLDPWTVAHWNTLTVPGRTFLRVVQVLPDGATSIAGYARTDVSP